MENKKENFINEQLTKTFKYKSMILDQRKKKLINQYNEELKSYVKLCTETDTLSQNVDTLNFINEHEVKMTDFYQKFSDVSKSTTDVNRLPSKNYETMYFSKDNSNVLTTEQRLKIKINRNAALILRMEKQLNVINSKLDERKDDLITKYKNYLNRKNNN